MESDTIANWMRVVAAEGELLERILDGTWSIWNEGLSRPATGLWNTGQLRTPWGRERLRRFALVEDDGRLLASAKRYRFEVMAGGRAVQMCGFGAVFTPEPERGRGHASRLLEEVMDSERREGVALAALFSEIGTRFYERLGFVAIPRDEVTVRVRPKDGAPAMLVRAGEERDLAAISAMHDIRTAGVPFALRRDTPLVHYAIAKKRMLAGLGPTGLRHVEFFVAEEGTSAVAYVVLSANANGWTLEEAGDRDPAGARLGAMLQVLVAREPSHPVPLIRAWWPSAFPVPPQLELTDPTPARDVLMLRPLTADVHVPRTAEEVFYWRSDHF